MFENRVGKVTGALVVLFLAGLCSASAQSLHIEDVTVAAGFTGFTDIALDTGGTSAKIIEFDIRFDPAAVQFTGITTGPAVQSGRRSLTFAQASSGLVNVRAQGDPIKERRDRDDDDDDDEEDDDDEDEDDDDDFDLEIGRPAIGGGVLGSFDFRIATGTPAQTTLVTLENIRLRLANGRLATAANVSATITIVAGDAELSVIGVTTPVLNFGATAVGSSHVLTVTLQETAGVAATISDISIVSSTQFSVASAHTLPHTIAANGTLRIELRFAPTEAGLATATLRITSDAANGTIALTLLGLGIDGPEGVVSIDAQDFGNVVVGTSAGARFRIFNTGNATLVLNDVSVEPAGPFAVTTPPGFPISIAAGASAAVGVSFTPSSTGAATATLSIASNAATPLATVALSGVGVLGPLATPGLLVRNASVQAGGSGSLSISLLNRGNTLVTGLEFDLLFDAANVSVTAVSAGIAALEAEKALTTVAIDGGLHVSISGLTQEAIGDGAVANVHFTAGATAGAFPLTVDNATFSVRSSLTLALAAPVTGNVFILPLPPPPVLSLLPAVLDFGIVAAGDVRTRSLVLANVGGGTLEVESIAIASGSAAFELATTAGPLTLASGQSSAIQVEFSPGASGAFAGSLRIESNSGGIATTTFAALVGLGFTQTAGVFVFPGAVINLATLGDIDVLLPGAQVVLVFPGLAEFEGQTLVLNVSGTIGFQGTLVLTDVAEDGVAEFVLTVPQGNVNGTLVLTTQGGAPLQSNQVQAQLGGSTGGFSGGVAAAPTPTPGPTAAPTGGTFTLAGAPSGSAGCSLTADPRQASPDFWLFLALGLLAARGTARRPRNAGSGN